LNLWSLKFVIIKANNTVKGNIKQELPVHVYYILIRSNKMQQYAGSVALGHAGGRLLLWYMIWPVPEAAVTVFCTPDDGCDRHPKHVA